MAKKIPKGAIKTEPCNGTDWLPLVPDITDVIADPRVRASLLLLDWEGASPASTGPLPYGPPVLFSKRCSDSVEGRGFSAALVNAASSEWLTAMERAWRHVA
jgi:hypothetical protein